VEPLAEPRGLLVRTELGRDVPAFTEYSVDSQVLGDMTFTKTPQQKQQ